MTETEWLACDDPQEIVAALRGMARARKTRLIGCACARFVWCRCGEPPPIAIEAAEGYADGCETKGVLRRARKAAEAQRKAQVAANPAAPLGGALYLAETIATLYSFGTAVTLLTGLSQDILLLGEDDWSALRGLIRDIAGNPFRPTGTEPPWKTVTVASLALAAYEARTLPEGTFELEHLAILSDALEEAGCTDEAILSHLRSPGPHVRGCWALDLILGKD